jgi:type I restriction enzyme M protein
VNDGALLFLQHMIAKMRAPKEGGSRIAIVFNGSPLFTGDAGSGESEIRRWIIENDWLEAVVALPEQLFYNTGISTYLWVLTNRKEKARKGKVQLIDARLLGADGEEPGQQAPPHRRSGDKDKDPDHIGDITRIFGAFKDYEKRTFTEEDPITHQPVRRNAPSARCFDNEDFGYRKITVSGRCGSTSRPAPNDRPPRPGKRLPQPGRQHLENAEARLAEIDEGKQRQDVIRRLLQALGKARGTRCTRTVKPS